MIGNQLQRVNFAQCGTFNAEKGYGILLLQFSLRTLAPHCVGGWSGHIEIHFCHFYCPIYKEISFFIDCVKKSIWGKREPKISTSTQKLESTCASLDVVLSFYSLKAEEDHLNIPNIAMQRQQRTHKKWCGKTTK